MHKHSQNIILQEDACEVSMDISLHKTSVYMVYGIISNTEGEALHNVTVKLVDQKLNPIKHTITSKDGSFVLLPNEVNSYQLILSKPGFTTLLVKTITLNQLLYFTLKRTKMNTCNVIGKCFYDDATFAKNVVIILDKETSNTRVITDCQGCFAFFQLHPGLHKLEILGETCVSFKAYFELYDGDEYIALHGMCLAKKNIGCTIHGIIKEQDGTVLPNILVLLYCSHCENFVMKTYTNEDGVYFFGNLEKGSYYIKAIY